MSEICFCCLSDETDAMINVHVIDKTIKKSYKEMVLEFIKMKFDDAENIVICFECRNVLRKIISFLEMCRRNNKDRLNDDDKLLEAKDQSENLPEQIGTNDTLDVDLDVVNHDAVNKPKTKNPATRKLKKRTKTLTSSNDIKESIDENDSMDDSSSPIVEKISVEKSCFVEKDDNTEIKTSHHIEEDETEENKDEFQEDKITPVDVNCSSSSKPKNAKSLLCSDCGQIFATSQRLKVHSFTHSGIKEFKCSEKLANGEVCVKSFATEFRLKTHQRIHLGLKPYKCKFSGCDAAFAQGNALKNHERLHTNLKPYKCTICSKQFVQNTTLKTHMAVHNGKKVPCTWPGCLKKFARISFMKVHLRQHTGEKPYICSFENCTNRYLQQSHLKRHMDTHKGVKFKCDICSRVYTKAWSLKQHKFSHSNNLPYKCKCCGEFFARRDKMNRHFVKVHGLKSDSTGIEEQAIIVEVENVDTSGGGKNFFLVPSNTETANQSEEVYTIHEG